MKNADMPASPIFDSQSRLRAITCDEGFTSMAAGLTKREAFAMAAMQGLLSAASNNDGTWTHGGADTVATESVYIADEVLKELDK